MNTRDEIMTVCILEEMYGCVLCSYVRVSEIRVFVVLSARLSKNGRRIIDHPLNRKCLSGHITKLASGIRRSHQCRCLSACAHMTSRALTTKDNTDILRCHEVYSGMLSHSVQMQHKRA